MMWKIDEDEGTADPNLARTLWQKMSDGAENLLLTITEKGAGKLSSSHDYSRARARRSGCDGDGQGNARREIRRFRSRSKLD